MENQRIKENIFYACYVECVIVMMKMFTVWIPFWSPILEVLAQILPLFSFVLILANIKRINVPLVLCACLLYVLGFSQWFPFDNFIYIAIIILLIGNFNFNKTIKIHFWTFTIYTLILIGLTFFNVIEPVVFSSGDRIRRAFAFVHPNIFSLPMLSIFSTWLYLLIKKEFIRCQYCDVYEDNIHKPNKLLNIFAYREFGGNQLFIKEPEYREVSSLLEKYNIDLLILRKDQSIEVDGNWLSLYDYVGKWMNIVYENDSYVLLLN